MISHSVCISLFWVEKFVVFNPMVHSVFSRVTYKYMLKIFSNFAALRNCIKLFCTHDWMTLTSIVISQKNDNYHRIYSVRYNPYWRLVIVVDVDFGWLRFGHWDVLVHVENQNLATRVDFAEIEDDRLLCNLVTINWT